MYSDIFCQVYNVFGWNYYPEIFGEQLLQWIKNRDLKIETAMDLGCGTGVLCEILRGQGICASGMDFSSGMIDIARERCPEIHYEVADMITFHPDRQFDLVTCTGDALNHIAALSDVEAIFRNVYSYTRQGGYFIFDILNEREVSTSEPFDLDFSRITVEAAGDTAAGGNSTVGITPLPTENTLKGRFTKEKETDDRGRRVYRFYLDMEDQPVTADGELCEKLFSCKGTAIFRTPLSYRFPPDAVTVTPRGRNDEKTALAGRVIRILDYGRVVYAAIDVGCIWLERALSSK